MSGRAIVAAAALSLVAASCGTFGSSTEDSTAGSDRVESSSSEGDQAATGGEPDENEPDENEPDENGPDADESDVLDWMTFTPEDGAFTVDFPGQPELVAVERILPTADETAQVVAISRYEVQLSETSGYAVSQEVYPAGYEFTFTESPLANSSTAEVELIEPRTVNGSECQFTIASETFPDEVIDGETRDVTIFVHHMACIGPETTYDLLVLGEDPISPENSMRFFESFEIG